MKQLKDIMSEHGWHVVIALAGALLLCTLLWFRLGSLTYGNAADIEVARQQSADSWMAILHNPLNAPYSVVQAIVRLTGYDGITSLRLISTVFAAIAAVLFYIVARQWHNLRVALLASWLFVSSAWFLHVARLGSAEILWLVSILAIVVLLTPTRHGRHTPLALPATLLVLSTALYVPGMVWLVLAGVVSQRKSIREARDATAAGWLRFASIAGSIILLVPLVYAFIRSPQLIKPWIGLPAGPLGENLTLNTVAHNLAGVPESILVYSSFDPVHWLGHLPLLSSFEIIMFLLGTYFYATHLRAARTRLIVVLAGVAWLLVGTIGLNAISLVVPVVYLLAAAGIAYILHLWLRVFPNNPIARSAGIIIIMIAVLLTSVYQTRSYFVAWRYNPETLQSFHTKL